MSIHKNPKLLDEVRQFMRLKHYSIHTERNYCDWIRQFIKFHRFTNKSDLLVNSAERIESFLSYLALERKVAASAQNQAMNALIFLYRQVLDQPLVERIDAIRSSKNRRIPVVLDKDEVRQTIALMDGVSQLIVKLLYGSGLRITEAVRLRVQDIDFEYQQITVRSGKGNKDRVTPISSSLEPLMRNHFVLVK